MKATLTFRLGIIKYATYEVVKSKRIVQILIVAWSFVIKMVKTNNKPPLCLFLKINKSREDSVPTSLVRINKYLYIL